MLTSGSYPIGIGGDPRVVKSSILVNIDSVLAMPDLAVPPAASSLTPSRIPHEYSLTYSRRILRGVFVHLLCVCAYTLQLRVLVCV